MDRLVYLDNAASMKLSNEVFQAMEPYLFEEYGNPSSVSRFALKSRVAVEQSRNEIARTINARKEQIIFTSGGSEANNLALRGMVKANRNKDCHIITTSIEHHSILNTCADLESEGVSVTYLGVDQEGLIDLATLEQAITANTVLISIIHGNNEVGTIQPIERIGEIARKHGVYFHVDAVQSFGVVPIDVTSSNIDLLSISAHKLHGPKGVGALYVAKPETIRPIITGGSQERKLRAGTLNTPGIVGLGAAAALARREMAQNNAVMTQLRDYFIDSILQRFPQVRLNGSRSPRLPNNINLFITGIANETLLVLLDGRGIVASSGSACASGSLEPSHVLMAMYNDDNRARESIRLTISKHTTKEELDYTLDALSDIIGRLEDAKT